MILARMNKGLKKIKRIETLLFIVDFLVCDVQVDQSVTKVKQHIGNVLVNQVVANFLRLSEGYEPRLTFGVIRQVLKFNLANKLGEMLILSE
jgi:hypothetical protein